VAVSSRLGYDPFLASTTGTLFAEIQRVARGFRTTVRWVDAQNEKRGEREIFVDGNDCADAVELMGLTISLTLDPSSVVSPVFPALEIKPAALPRPRPNTPPAPEAGVASPRGSPYVGLGVLGSVRAAPASSAGGTVFVGAAWRRLSLDLEGRVDLPATGRADAGPARVRSWLLVGSVVPCVHRGVAFGCAVLSGGIIDAAARNVTTIEERHGPWSAAGGRLGAEWIASDHLHLRAHADLLAVLTRDAFWVDAARIYTVRSWTGALEIDALWRFR
jgi:hypothetical protein